jgi:hypothetical protein
MNLLVALHKWACDRKQDENFTTEAFAHLLRHLLKHEPDAACSILAVLGCSSVGEDCRELKVSTQIRYGHSQPDISVEQKAKLKLVIEVKVEQEIDWDQIKMHNEALERKAAPYCKRLIVLTKKQVDKNNKAADLVDTYVRWREIAESIRAEVDGGMSPVSQHIARQFVDFLRSNGMVIDKVETAITTKQAISSFHSLMKMIKGSLPQGSPPRKWKSKDNVCEMPGYSGVYFGLRRNDEYWCGIYYAEPDCVVLQAYDRSAAEIAKCEGWELDEEDKSRGAAWRRKLPLRERKFFEMQADDQWKLIEAFIKNSIEALK